MRNSGVKRIPQQVLNWARSATRSSQKFDLHKVRNSGKNSFGCIKKGALVYSWACHFLLEHHPPSKIEHPHPIESDPAGLTFEYLCIK